MRIFIRERKFYAYAALIAATFYVFYLVFYDQFSTYSLRLPPSSKPHYQLSVLTDLFKIQSISSENSGDDDLIVVYNRIPKTGSTTVINVVNHCSIANRIHTINVNTSHARRFSQSLNLDMIMHLVRNVSLWQRMKPALYHGHFPFIDFQTYGMLSVNPVYIQVVRHPMHRWISYYYFLRFGDDFRPHVTRRHMWDQKKQNMTFDDCFTSGEEECVIKHLWFQIPYFCGNYRFCWEPANNVALEQAMQNVRRYLLVGITEELEDFFIILERILPRFFNGTVEALHSMSRLSSSGEDVTSTLLQLRRTLNKRNISIETEAIIQTSEVYKMEMEFYNYVKDLFHETRRQLYDRDSDGSVKWYNYSLYYQRIRPSLRGNSR